MKSKKAVEPIFNHFCSECIFLKNHKKIDLYFCNSKNHKDKYIIRYGNNKTNTLSGNGEDLFFPELAQAKIEAEKHGLN